MYAKGEDGEDELKQDILDQLEAHANADARVISSSRPFRDKDDRGNDPPHLLARTAYESITDYPVLCTGSTPPRRSPARWSSPWSPAWASNSSTSPTWRTRARC
ncbi:hypothetical protein GCM10020295_00290 [Streptomyces cinereospinus]